MEENKEKFTTASVKNFETDVDYTTVLDNFEGPLDLLLYLIKQEEIEEGTWNNWMDKTALDSDSEFNSEANGAQREINSPDSILPTVTSANLEGSSSDLRARRSEDMTKLAELRSQKENNPAIIEAEANVKSLKVAYDEALVLVEQQETAQLDANIAQLEQNLLSYDGAILKTELKNSAKNSFKNIHSTSPYFFQLYNKGFYINNS